MAALARQILDYLESDNVELSVMTLDEASTSVYFGGIARQIPFKTVFFGRLFEACCEHHVIVLCEGGWDGTRPLLGIAPVNPFCWPVRPSLARLARAALTGNRDLQFQSWYFFSWSVERERAYHAYIDALAQAMATFCLERGFQPVIVGMEQLNRNACVLLQGKLALADRSLANTPLVLSNDHDGFVISEVLRSLSVLATSRYHAQVLATGASVPAVAVSMDERLDNLAQELNVPGELLLHVDEKDLVARLLLALDYAIENRAAILQRLDEARTAALETVKDMSDWFARFVKSNIR